MKRKRIVLIGLCLLVITGVFSLVSTGICQQGPGADKPNAAPAQQVAPSEGAEAKVAPADTEAKAQAVASPDSQKADEKLRRKLQETEGCAAGG